jgi:hypothetical protein
MRIKVNRGEAEDRVSGNKEPETNLTKHLIVTW